MNQGSGNASAVNYVASNEVVAFAGGQYDSPSDAGIGVLSSKVAPFVGGGFERKQIVDERLRGGV